jgi:hypothetical protein
MRHHLFPRTGAAVAMSAAAAIGLLGSGAAASAKPATTGAPAATSARALNGTFVLTPGRYSRGRASGTHFRMIVPGGRGYFRNPDSSARDKSYTLLRPGRSGGLVTGRYQPAGRPAFTRDGHSRASLIIRPTRFANIRFGLATLPRDPQSRRNVPTPRINATGRRLSGQVQALTATWNKQYFNQGTPKPGSSGPLVRGSYNPRTRAFTLTWRSRISGGPFNGFTGLWHLQGRFKPRGGAAVAIATAEKLKGRKRCRSKKFKAKHRKYCKRKRKRITPPPPGSQELLGTFRLDAGAYSRANGPSGSWFRMVFPDGSANRGPFFSNPSSASSDQTFTTLSPGTDGGFTTGLYQPPPSPAFTDRGDSLANRIIQPQRFAGVDFGLSTSPRDVQTGIDVPAPSIVAAPDGKLSGQVKGWTASWNKLYFNQGSPKPNGTFPRITAPLKGTYDPATRKFTIEWASSIVGGPFNRFTGVWHLTGTFVPR